MEEVVRAEMLATTTITAIAGDRINWDKRPQGSPFPDIVLHLISDIPEMGMSGPTGWRDARVQADCWATRHLQARDLGLAVEAKMNGLRIDAYGKKYRAFVIDAASRPDTTGNVITHRRQVDLRISYQA
jgi:hypothetical protein